MRLCQTCGRLSDDGAASCPVDGQDTIAYSPSVPIGEAIAGAYRIVAALGVGQSGEVYEGRAEAGGERVVVRVLSEDMAKDKRLSDVVRRHLLKQKDFPHKYVVPLRAVDARNERIVAVRDWVDGKRLEDVLRQDGALSVARALDLAVRFCSALAEAHKVGLLHLQLRASNVFVVPAESGDGESVRLVDFGIGPRRKIGPRPVYGQPATLSPEQIEGKIVSFKSDMFSAGLLLYRMLAGNLPWTGDDDAVVRQILDAPVPPIPHHDDAPLPVELWALIRQTLEKKPIHRPIGMAQMADRLRELQSDAAAGRLSVEVPMVGADAATPAPPLAPRPPERAMLGKIALKSKVPTTPPGPRIPAPPVVPVPPAARAALEPTQSLATQDIEVAIDDGKGPPKVEIAPDAVVAPPAPAAAGAAPSAPHPPGDDGPTLESAPPAEMLAAARTDQPDAAGPGVIPPSSATLPGEPEPLALPPPAAAKGATIASSSDTMPLEPDIIEEAMVPPPLRAPRPPGRDAPAAGGAGEGLGGAYKRGLFSGLAAGLAVAVIAFFCAMYLFRGRTAPPAPERSPGASSAAADGGAGVPRLTAEGPMQVSAVGGDAGGSVAAAAEAGAVADAGARPADATVPSGPEQDVATAMVAADAAPLPEPAADAVSAARDAGRPADRAAPSDAATHPAAEAGERPAPADATAGAAGRPEAGGGAAENIARSNELVAQGDAALAGRDFSGARAAYQEALQLQANNNRAKIGLGRVAFQQGDFEEAVRYLEPIYRSQGNMDLGVAYVRLGRLPDARAQFQKLVDRNPNNQDAQHALDAVNRQLGP